MNKQKNKTTLKEWREKVEPMWAKLKHAKDMITQDGIEKNVQKKWFIKYRKILAKMQPPKEVKEEIKHYFEENNKLL